MASVIANLLKGDKVGIQTDYRDYLPVNMSGILRNHFGVSGYMLQEPGITKYSTGIGIDRGGLWNERHSNHYRVSGNKLIKIDAAGGVVTLGDISGLDIVSMPYSFNTQGILADGRFWLYSPTGGFVEVVDLDLGNPIDAVWIDGYYFFTDGEYLFHSDITAETSISQFKFATSEFSPDPTLGVGKTVDNKAIAFNRYTTEYFANRATANFAFTRIPTRALKTGIVGTHCKAEMDNRWYIMGGRKEESVSIHVIGVGGTENIASREVDRIIAQYTEPQLSSSVLEAKVDKKYHYLICHLPNETLLWNMEIAKAAGTEMAWSVLESDGSPWRGIFGLFEPRRGEWVYGDKQTSSVGFVDESIVEHFGSKSEWQLSTPFIQLEGASIDSLEIETAPGHNVNDDASVFVSLTYDGITHGREWIRSYGKPSEYGHRFILNRLGYVNNWVGIKLRGNSTSRMAFSRAKLEVG